MSGYLMHHILGLPPCTKDCKRAEPRGHLCNIVPVCDRSHIKWQVRSVRFRKFSCSSQPAMNTLLLLLPLIFNVLGKPIIYDGRAPCTLNSTALDISSGPYLT